MEIIKNKVQKIDPHGTLKRGTLKRSKKIKLEDVYIFTFYLIFA